MERESRTVDRAGQVDSSRHRHLPRGDVLVETRAERLGRVVASGLQVLHPRLEADRTAIGGRRYHHPADRTELWWNPKRPNNDRTLWESKIELAEKFFNEIIAHPVSLDLHILKAMKRSSLGLDLYLWLTYRAFALTRLLRLSWANLYRQFGANPAKAKDKVTVQNFRRKILRELKKIKTA